MGCGVLWQQVRELERALGSLRRLGISEVTEPYQKLFQLRGKLMKQVGFKLPRTISQILKLAALSPESLTLWHDVESGWMSEARAKPGTPPVYHYISDEEAVAIINKQVPPELKQKLLTPETYVGE